MNVIQTLKKGNLPICDNTDEPGGHNTKWNKPDMERQIPNDLMYIKSKIVNVIKAERRTMLPGVEGKGRNGKILIKDCKVLFIQDE